MWFGTSNVGIYNFDGTTLSWMYENHLTKTPAGGSFGIRSIQEDKAGYFWICNPNYKYKMAANNVESNQLNITNYTREIGIADSIDTNLCFLSMTQDNNGDLWMVSYDNGAWKYDGTKLINYPIKTGERNVTLFSIYKDKQGKLWVGTQMDGVYFLNGDKFEKFLLH